MTSTHFSSKSVLTTGVYYRAKHLPKAIYQANRFRVKMDLKQSLRRTEGLSSCLNVFDASNSKAPMGSLLSIAPEIEYSDKKKGASRVLKGIVKMPDSFMGYRERPKDI